MPIKIGASGLQQDAPLTASEIPFASDPWVVPTLGAGWTPSSDTPITYRRLTSHMNLLFIVGSARYTLTSGSYFNAIFTLPAGSRTSNNRYLVGTIVKDGGTYPLSLRLSSDGRLLVYLTQSPTYQEIWLDCTIHL